MSQSSPDATCRCLWCRQWTQHGPPATQEDMVCDFCRAEHPRAAREGPWSSVTQADERPGPDEPDEFAGLRDNLAAQLTSRWHTS